MDMLKAKLPLGPVVLESGLKEGGGVWKLTVQRREGQQA